MKRLTNNVVKVLKLLKHNFHPQLNILFSGEITGDNKEVKAEHAAPPSAPSPPPAPVPAKETSPTPPSSTPTPAPAPVQQSAEQIPHHVWQRPIIQVINSKSFLEILFFLNAFALFA